MTGVANITQIDELMDQASELLVQGKYFETERLCDRALRLARQSRAFERMARICLPLQEARRLRLQKALDLGAITILNTPQGDDPRVKPGCYLMQPPLVGADARRFRLAAFNQDVPAAVLCREPLTSMGKTPIVAIGLTTVRTRIDPPPKADKPTLEWYVAALEALGDAAISGVDAGIEPERQVDALLSCLDAHPDHEKLHQALAEACRRAEHEARVNPAPVRAAPSFDDDSDSDDLDGS
jgi:hypothetical protein